MGRDGAWWLGRSSLGRNGHAPVPTWICVMRSKLRLRAIEKDACTRRSYAYAILPDSLNYHPPASRSPTSQTPSPPQSHSVLQIIPDSPLQLRRPIPQHTRQILQIIPSRDPKPPHNVLRRALQIAILARRAWHLLVFGTAEVGVGGDGLGAFEALQTGLGFGLGVRIEAALAEEFVGGNAFLRAELFAGIAFGVV